LIGLISPPKYMYEPKIALIIKADVIHRELDIKTSLKKDFFKDLS